MAKLIANVHVPDHGWFGPAYPDAGDPPAGRVTNPGCWEDGQVPSSQAGGSSAKPEQPKAPEPSLNPAPASGNPPPRSGKGATDEAWTAYARNNKVLVSESMSRREVIAACEKAGVPT